MNLTNREIIVLQKLAEGMTVKEVARALFVQPSTIVTHKKNIYLKTNTRTSFQLGVIAAINGLLLKNDRPF